MSTHIIPVIRITNVETHPNADKLDIVRHGTYTVCTNRGSFKPGDLAVHILPDYLVPTDRPEFSFLAKPGEKYHRVRVSKRRGVISQGFLIPVPQEVIVNEGDNLMAHYGISRYEPPDPAFSGGEAERGPNLYIPVYDVEDYNNYSHLIQPGETVVVTEKIHGANGRFVFHGGRMYCGSRGEWKAENRDNLVWRCLEQNPWIKEFCTANPDTIMYGEIFGSTQNLRYGSKPGDYRFAAFDLLRGSEWIDPIEASVMVGANNPELMSKRWAPVIAVRPFNLEEIREMAEQDSIVEHANHMSEGVVIQPIANRTCIEIGRVKLKLVSHRYLMEKKK